MDKVEIVGFLNKDVYFPTFVITVVDIQGKYHAKVPFPGKALVIIPGAEKEDDLLRCPNFWKDTSSRQLDIPRDEFAFAFSRQQVAIGTTEELIREIQKQQIKKSISQDTRNKLDWVIQELKKNPVSSCYFK